MSLTALESMQSQETMSNLSGVVFNNIGNYCNLFTTLHAVCATPRHAYHPVVCSTIRAPVKMEHTCRPICYFHFQIDHFADATDNKISGKVQSSIVHIRYPSKYSLDLCIGFDYLRIRHPTVERFSYIHLHSK